MIEDELGDAAVTGPGLAGVVAQRWHHTSPATWNRHVATVRSFARYCERTRILEIDGDVELQRRAEQHDHTRSIPSASLERLWERRDIDLRERTLWRLLYETAARADEVLRLDIEDLAIPAKRARTRSKGDDVDWLFFSSGSARLLSRLEDFPPLPEPGGENLDPAIAQPTQNYERWNRRWLLRNSGSCCPVCSGRWWYASELHWW